MTDGEVRDVDADPAAVEFLRDGDRRAASAEWIENNVAFVGAKCYDAFEQRFWFLRLIPELFSRPAVYGSDVGPVGRDWHSLSLV